MSRANCYKRGLSEICIFLLTQRRFGFLWAQIGNSLSGRAAKQATTTIPIVIPVMGDPVEDGLVVSLARPGGNVTGSTFLGPQLVPKRLALLKEALPSAFRVAALWHPRAYGERTM